jgi:excisionase family DNA binding protein
MSAPRPRSSPPSSHAPAPAAVPDPFTAEGPPAEPPAERLAYSVDEAARLTGLSRDLLYDQMRRGHLAYLKVGRRRLITRQHLDLFLGITTSAQSPSTHTKAADLQSAGDAPRSSPRRQARA